MDTIRRSVTKPQISVSNVVELATTFATIHRLFERLVSLCFLLGGRGRHSRVLSLVHRVRGGSSSHFSSHNSSNVNSKVSWCKAEFLPLLVYVGY